MTARQEDVLVIGGGHTRPNTAALWLPPITSCLSGWTYPNGR